MYLGCSREAIPEWQNSGIPVHFFRLPFLRFRSKMSTSTFFLFFFSSALFAAVVEWQVKSNGNANLRNSCSVSSATSPPPLSPLPYLTFPLSVENGRRCRLFPFKSDGFDCPFISLFSPHYLYWQFHWICEKFEFIQSSLRPDSFKSWRSENNYWFISIHVVFIRSGNRSEIV